MTSQLYEYLPDKLKTRHPPDPPKCCRCGKTLIWPDVVLLNYIRKVCKKCYREIKETKQF